MMNQLLKNSTSTSIPLISVLAIALLFNIGCGSSTKKSDSKSHGTNDSKSAAKGNAHSGTSADEVEAQVGTSVDTKSLDERYAGMQQAVRSGKWESVKDEAVKILAKNPQDAIALNGLAVTYIRKGKFGAARVLIGRAFEKSSGSAGLHNNLGVLEFSEGNTELAKASFRKALQLDRSHVEANGNLGTIFVAGGDYNKALPMLDLAYRESKNPNFGVNFAVALRGTKDLVRSQKIYEEVLKGNPTNIAANLNYAVLLIDYLRKPKEGLPYLNKVRLLEDERKDILDRVNELEKKSQSEVN